MFIEQGLSPAQQNPLPYADGDDPTPLPAGPESEPGPLNGLFHVLTEVKCVAGAARRRRGVTADEWRIRLSPSSEIDAYVDFLLGVSTIYPSYQSTA